MESEKVAVMPDIEILELRKGHIHLWRITVALAVCLLFCVSGIIWLAIEVAENADDDNTDTGGLTAESELKLTRDATSSSEALFAGSGYWTIKEPLPFARSDHHTIAVDDFIYIIGGLNASDQTVADVSIYDSVLGTYAEGPPLPRPLYRFAAVYDDINRNIYVLGGLTDSDAIASSSVFVLNVDEKEWSEGPSLLAPRSDLCGAFVDRHVYAVGGYSANYTSTLNAVDALDTTTGKWRSVSNMPTPRGDCKAARMSDKLIVVGGYYDATGTWQADSFRNEVEVYSPAEKTWIEVAPMKNARGDKCISVLSDDRLLVIGGETHNRGLHTRVATHHVEEYIMSKDIWIDRSPLPTATFRADSAVVSGLVFVFGGTRTCEAPVDGQESNICTESNALQVFFDFDHPAIFID